MFFIALRPFNIFFFLLMGRTILSWVPQNLIIVVHPAIIDGFGDA
jgi:hypothetical protein